MCHSSIDKKRIKNINIKDVPDDWFAYVSPYCIGQEVIVSIGDSIIKENAFIRAITYTSGKKVRYSIYLYESDTTIHHVTSDFIWGPGKRYIEFGQNKWD